MTPWDESALQTEQPAQTETLLEEDSPSKGEPPLEDALPSEDVERQSASSPVWLLSAIESLVFCATEPLSPARLREILNGGEEEVSMAMVRAACRTLIEAWDSREERSYGRGMMLQQVSDGLVFRSVPENARWLLQAAEARPQKLSKAALDVLSIVAYRQPVTRTQIEEIRGVDCSSGLKSLLDRRLVRILGKSEDVGRPLLYGTTRTFLEFFGLDNLRDLPTLRDLDALEGIAPPEPVPSEDPGASIVRDLFSAHLDSLVSEETETESLAALSSLDRALDVVARASQPEHEPPLLLQTSDSSFAAGDDALDDEPENGAQDGESLQEPIIKTDALDSSGQVA